MWHRLIGFLLREISVKQFALFHKEERREGRENGCALESSVCAGYLSASVPVLWFLCPANTLGKTSYLQCFAPAEIFKVARKLGNLGPFSLVHTLSQWSSCVG